MVDAEGNAVVHCAFAGETRSLAIRAAMQVALSRCNPFDFVPGPSCASLPLAIDAQESAALARFLKGDATHDPEALAFADAVASRSDGVVPFLARLAREMKDRIHHYIRAGGYAQSPAETLALGAGACRDIAVLFIACCRAKGIPARYASGYRRGDLARRERDLHAWVEAYVPGGGWRGWDPTEGVAVADTHVVLATAPDQYGTLPVEGSFSGTAGATLTYDVEITSP